MSAPRCAARCAAHNRGPLACSSTRWVPAMARTGRRDGTPELTPCTQKKMATSTCVGRDCGAKGPTGRLMAETQSSPCLRGVRSTAESYRRMRYCTVGKLSPLAGHQAGPLRRCGSCYGFPDGTPSSYFGNSKRFHCRWGCCRMVGRLRRSLPVEERQQGCALRRLLLAVPPDPTLLGRPC